MITSGTSRCEKNGDESTTRLEQEKHNKMTGIEYALHGLILACAIALIVMGVLYFKKS